ncbi:MAG: fasciclin domain-containing protein [Phycisphaerales bacterium JB037]
MKLSLLAAATLAAGSLAGAGLTLDGPPCSSKTSETVAKSGGCSGTTDTASTMTVAMEYDKDIIEIASGAGSFNTLVAAVKAAGLVDVLKSDGPFTVFAPTDEAFAKLPKGTVENLLKPENRDTLIAILTYHVLPAKVEASQVVNTAAAGTVNGQRVQFSVDANGVRIDNARIIKTDITASNGVIHVIDSVILPSDKNIVQTAAEAGSFQTLLAAAKAAGLADALMGEGPYTVFAPTDDAFAALGADTIQTLLKPENRGKLADILKYHVVKGRVYANQAVTAGSAKTLEGSKVNAQIVDGRLRINGANVVASDLDASNGVIHVIDKVLLPSN